LNYRLYKKGISFENYLEILKDKDLFLLCRLRICNHRISIDIGRWQNINRENRVCNLCQGMKLGDEFNYLLECTEFIQDRARLIPKKYRCSPNTVKYCALMCSNYVAELSKLCKFIRIVNSKVCPIVLTLICLLPFGNWCKYVCIFDIYLFTMLHGYEK
jgi:hypothetical protein